MKPAVLMLLSGFAAVSQDLPAPTDTDSYTVIYTGRTLGNFRNPEIQSDGSSGSPMFPGPTAESYFKTRLDDEVSPGASGTTIRVATGDNFAPFLLARKVWRTSELVDKEGGPPFDDPAFDQYVHGNATIPADNVASFFIDMKFDALVPGKEDFYFGPEHLRELARLMRTQPCDTRSDAAKTCGPRMLGSNLVLHTQRTDVNQPNGIAQPPDPPRPSGNAGRGPNDPLIALPKVALPWMRAVRIKNALSVQFQPAAGPSRNSGRMLATSTPFEEPEISAFQNWLQTFRFLPKPPFEGPQNPTPATTASALTSSQHAS